MWPFRQRKAFRDHSSPVYAINMVASRQPDEGPYGVLSLLSPHEAKALGGFRSEAICGTVDGRVFTTNHLGSDDSGTSQDRPSHQDFVDHFRANPDFIGLLHAFLSNACPRLPSLQTMAADQSGGSIPVIDQRTPKGILGNVPMNDIIGVFGVENDQINASTYHPNDEYVPFSTDGLIQLPPPLHQQLISAIRATYRGRWPSAEKM